MLEETYIKLFPCIVICHITVQHKTTPGVKIFYMNSFLLQSPGFFNFHFLNQKKVLVSKKEISHQEIFQGLFSLKVICDKTAPSVKFISPLMKESFGALQNNCRKFCTAAKMIFSNDCQHFSHFPPDKSSAIFLRKTLTTFQLLQCTDLSIIVFFMSHFIFYN